MKNFLGKFTLDEGGEIVVKPNDPSQNISSTTKELDLTPIMPQDISVLIPKSSTPITIKKLNVTTNNSVSIPQYRSPTHNPITSPKTSPPHEQKVIPDPFDELIHVNTEISPRNAATFLNSPQRQKLISESRIVRQNPHDLTFTPRRRSQIILYNQEDEEMKRKLRAMFNTNDDLDSYE
jgi:hypothetical protein